MSTILYYESKFALSAEWIIIIIQIKTVLNDNDELQNTSDVTNPDIINVETIDDIDQHVANKEVEVMNDENISVATGFHHEKKHNQGLTRKKCYQMRAARHQRKKKRLHLFNILSL